MRVVIVAKTRMSGGMFCVGGLSADDGTSLRLLQPNGLNQPPDSPFDTGEIWVIDGRRKPDCVAPHIEDFLVTQKHLLGRQPLLAQFLLKRVNPWRGSPDRLFDGLIRFTWNRSGYISRRNQLPGCSTGFWLSDRTLSLDQQGEKASYHYASPALTYRISYVGTAPARATIPPGMLVRVSLARWWRPDDAPDCEERCYLQLSGYYDDEHFTSREGAAAAKPVDSEEVIPF